MVIGCTLCGRSLSHGAHRRVELLDSLCRGLRLLKLNMTSMFEPLAHALSSTHCPLLEQVGRALRPGTDAASAWNAVCAREARRGGSMDALCGEDRQVLEGLFRHLGESGRDAQELMLEAAIRRLDENLRAARARALEADRLYISLGLLIGLMLALIVL